MNNISNNSIFFTLSNEDSGKALVIKIYKKKNRKIMSYEAKYENQTVGKADLIFSQFDGPNDCFSYLNHLSNKTEKDKENLRIRGIGTALVETMIKDSIETDKGKLRLYSLPTALGFYWKLGFRLTESDNVRDRRTEVYVKFLEGESETFRVPLNHPSIVDSNQYKEAQKRLAQKLNKSLSEVDVFEDIKTRPPSFVSDKIQKKIEQAGKERPKTKGLGCRTLYLPEESLAIWKEIINNPASREENFKKLRAVPQPKPTKTQED